MFSSVIISHQVRSISLRKVYSILSWTVTSLAIFWLESLLGSGQLTSLRSNEKNGYYACVLASGQPGSVPVGLSATEYQALLPTLHAASGSASG